MLPIAAFWLVLATNALRSQTKIEWGDSLVVQQTAHFITAPRVNLLDDGTVVAVWGESSTPSKIWCSRLENGQFSAPVSVVTAAPAPLLFGFGGFDVAVFGQKIFVVFERSGSGIFVSRSEDGGASFLPPVKVSAAVVGGYATLASLAADESGNLFVDYIQEKSGTATHQICRSTDGGQTFSAPVEASAHANGTKVCECCIGAPLASQGSVWLAFRNNNANIRDHWVSRSTDLASTFDTATDVDDSDWAINACPISSPRIARSGDSLVIVWKTGAGGGSKVFASTLHGSTMTAGQQIRLGDANHLSENQNQPDIAAAGDTLGIVFQENDRLAFAFSTEGLAGLAENYGHFEEAGQELRVPAVAFRDGNFHLVYANAASGEVIYRRGEIVPTVGVSENEGQFSAVSVFPNPSTDGFFWLKSEASDLVACSVFDVFGKCLGSKKLGGRMSKIDMAGLPPGVYDLKIKTERGEVGRKLMLGF